MDITALRNQYEEDKKKYEAAKDKISFWNIRFNNLRDDLQSLTADFQKMYEDSEFIEGLPQELKDKLDNRRQGIRLSFKSASKLLSKLPAVVPVEPGTLLPIPEGRPEEQPAAAEAESDTQELNSGETAQTETPSADSPEVNPEETANADNDNPEPEQESTEEQESLDPIMEANEELIGQMQDNLEQLERKFASFIEKNLAPVMDGLYSGKNYSRELEEEAAQSFPEQAEYVSQWLGVYQHMMDTLKELLDKYSVALLKAEPNEFFNENLHEPIAVEPDETLQDEQIKGMVRYGFTYSGELFGQKNFLIRPAQVIVVKN